MMNVKELWPHELSSIEEGPIPRIEEVEIEWIDEDYPDISWLEDNAGITLDEAKDIRDWEAEERLPTDQREARERLYNYGNTWAFCGVQAIAKLLVQLPNGKLARAEERSPGLWNIESDSKRTDFGNSIELEELEHLRDELENYDGLDLEPISEFIEDEYTKEQRERVAHLYDRPPEQA